MVNQKYKVRIEAALHYIEAHKHEKIRLSDVAKVSHFSEFHFHRIFSSAMGETLNDYIARRRLECAVNMLVFDPEKSMTEVALSNGFSSSANFSKAVRAYFGFSPSEIRNPAKNKHQPNASSGFGIHGFSKNSKIGKIVSKYGKAFDPADLYPARITNNVSHIAGTKIMNVEIKTLEPQTISVLPSEGGYAQDAIFATWDKLIAWAKGCGIEEREQQRFALAYDNPAVTPLDKCRYEAAVVIDSELVVNPPFKKALIPGGRYAVLYYKGAPDETNQAHMSLYGDWLPQSGFEPDNFPMMEHYLNDVRQDGYLEMEIYVKLKEITI
ncbi:MAG: AraC family transcriptional regulator [Thiolinea sp.]